MIVGTVESRALCKRIAGQTSTVVMGFSRGKDSIAAAVWLREFFENVILFHVSACPGVDFVESSLRYYEDRLGMTIHRCISRDFFESVDSMHWQPIEFEDSVDSLHLLDHAHSTDKVARLIRDAYATPDAWMAFGISAEDSIIRRSQKKYREGINSEKRIFYPCFNWRKEHVMQAIESAVIALPQDYLMANRSFEGPMNSRHLKRMMELRPQSFAQVEWHFPFIRAQVARNQFRAMHQGAGSLKSNSPSLPETGNGSIDIGRAKTKPKKSSPGTRSKQEAADIASEIGTGSSTPTRSTMQSATPRGKRRSSAVNPVADLDAQIKTGPR